MRWLAVILAVVFCCQAEAKLPVKHHGGGHGVPPSAPQSVGSVSLSANQVPSGSPAGTTIGTISTVMSPASPSFVGTYTVSGANAAHYQIVNNNTLQTATAINDGSESINIVATQSGVVNSPVTLPVTITIGTGQVISSVALSNNTVAASSPSGTTVGTITVTMNPAAPAFTGSLSLTGTNAASFQLSGNALQTNGSLSAGTYNLNIVATQSGISNSPLSQPEVITASSTGDPTIGFIPTDRDAWPNWKTAGLISVGGVPTNRTQCGSTISPVGGGGDDSVNINNAIQACTSGHYVLLSSGTFTLTGSNYINLNKDGITLRGAGAGITTIQRSGPPPSSSTQIIIAGPPRFTAGPSATTNINLTADAAQGATTISLNCGGNCASTFVVGEIVMLDELSLAGGGQPEPNPVLVSQGFPLHQASVDWRLIYPNHIPSCSPCGDEPGDITSNTFGRTDRNTNEMKEISAISGNTVTFTSPLTISYRTANTAQLTRFEDAGTHAYTPHVKNVGVELLTMKWGDNGNLSFVMCAYCWAKNVESTLWSGVGIDFAWAFRNELREFYSHQSILAHTTGGAYALGIDQASSEILFENGISVVANKVMVARGAGAGSVIGYNYMDRNLIQDSSTDCVNNGCWVEMGLNASHWVGPHHVLFEGNWGYNGDSDHTHGSSVHITFFRNWLTGFRTAFTNPYSGTNNLIDDANQPFNGPQRAAGPSAFGYYFSYVGNVMGTSGLMSGWNYQSTGGTNGKSIFFAGWGDVDSTGDWSHLEPKILNSSFAGVLVRNGNWDWVTSTQKWDGTPATIPNSFYLSSKPAFFGASTWPWVDPTTGTTLTLPAKARFDANTPNCNC